MVRHGQYASEPARPFRTASLDHIQCGHVDCAADERGRGANLGLYSVTFNNRLDEDLASLERYRQFREEAERKGFRHFLEVFDPNAPQGLSPETTPQFVNDCIARTLAGVAAAGRPIFLKIVYHGPRAMEELVAYDPHLVVGILGGGAGTTYDAFKLIAEAQKYGARAALFGRKINNAECQLAFVEFLRRIVDGQVTPGGSRAGISWRARAAEDQAATLAARRHATAQRRDELRRAVDRERAQRDTEAKPAAGGESATAAKHDCGCGGPSADKCHCHDKPASPTADGEPDFSRMTVAEKLAYNKAKRDRVFGT